MSASTSAAADAVSVDREALLEAVAWLYAASEFFIALNGAVDSRIGELFENAGVALKNAAFGPGPDDDREWERDPINVETQSRAYARASMAVDRLMGTREFVSSPTSDDLAVMRDRFDNAAWEINATGSLHPSDEELAVAGSRGGDDA